VDFHHRCRRRRHHHRRDQKVVVSCFSYNAVINLYLRQLCLKIGPDYFYDKFRRGGRSGVIFPQVIAGCNTEVASY